MLWFDRTTKTAAWNGPSALFRKRMEREVKPFLDSDALDIHGWEDEAWDIIGTRAVLWAERDQDPYSPMRHVPKFQLIADVDGVSSIVDESADIAALIQRARTEFPESPEVPPVVPQTAPWE